MDRKHTIAEPAIAGHLISECLSFLLTYRIKIPLNYSQNLMIIVINVIMINKVNVYIDPDFTHEMTRLGLCSWIRILEAYS